MNTYIITGATGGLGLSTAKFLAQEPGSKVLLAVRDIDRGRTVAAQIGVNIEVAELNLSSAESIESFISSWRGSIAGLINNAGVQIVNETRFTPEGFEETFAVNHLAALKLTLGLLPFIENGRVLFIGSGTHNPNNRTATIFGFRGARFESIQKCAAGLNHSEPIRQLGMDRYATSKFLNMVTTIEMARRVPVNRVAFHCLDPGMMPGTGLARTAPAFLQFAWSNILPFLSKLMPDTSTPNRSGKAAAWIMTNETIRKKTGIIFSYDCKPSNRVWNQVFDPDIGQRVIDDSLRLLDIGLIRWAR